MKGTPFHEDKNEMQIKKTLNLHAVVFKVVPWGETWTCGTLEIRNATVCLSSKKQWKISCRHRFISFAYLPLLQLSLCVLGSILYVMHPWVSVCDCHCWGCSWFAEADSFPRARWLLEPDRCEAASLVSSRSCMEIAAILWPSIPIAQLLPCSFF